MTWNYTNIPVFHVLYINTAKDTFLLVTIIIKYTQGKWIKWFYGQSILAITFQEYEVVQLHAASHCISY